jgi:hypothetical protein
MDFVHLPVPGEMGRLHDGSRWPVLEPGDGQEGAMMVAAAEMLCGSLGRCGWRLRAGPIWAQPGPGWPRSMLALAGCFAPDLGQEVAAPASAGAAWRPDPAEEEDAGAAAPGVRAFLSLLRCERVWREATRREVLRCSLPQWWWWWVAACCRVCSATASLADRRRRLWVW